MKIPGMVGRSVFMVGIAVCLVAASVGTSAHAAHLQAGSWTGGAAQGFLGNTLDGTAFALNFHADAMLEQRVSLGPLLQLAFTGDLTQVGVSGQGKYWMEIPDTAKKGRLVLQAGLGFVHADRLNSDTSFLIPLGVGLDYQLNKVLALKADFLLNFTDLEETGPGRADDTNVMPGLTFGVRF